MHDDVAASRPTYRRCLSVRVTPYGDDGYPDYTRSVRHRFTVPVVMAHTYRRRLPPIGSGLFVQAETLPALVQLAAPHDHGEPDLVASLTETFRALTGHASVDVWEPTADGPGYSTVVVCWRQLPEDDWPDPDPADDNAPRIITVGTSHPASHSLPSAPSAPWGVDAGTALVLATHGEPE
ncbi:hypothetical protein ACIPQH_25035 [Streptomyces rubiginosohelvolus]|uniref:hypothetical protein n=1 Tax=Streptomyces rubiginosohelvolus TaxID=67362 RepID=UPI0037FC26AC